MLCLKYYTWTRYICRCEKQTALTPRLIGSKMVKSKGKSSPDRQSSTRQKPNISKKSVGSESKYIPVDPRVFKDKIIDKFHPQWAISQLVSPHENSEFSKNMIFVAFFAWMFCPKDKTLRIGLIYRSVISA